MCYSCGFYAWIWSIFLRLEAIEARSDPLPLDEDVMSQSAGGRGTASGLGGEVNLEFFFRWGLFTNHETKTLIGVLFTKNKLSKWVMFQNEKGSNFKAHTLWFKYHESKRSWFKTENPTFNETPPNYFDWQESISKKRVKFIYHFMYTNYFVKKSHSSK